MGLDKATEQKVCDWLAKKGHLACPLCRGNAWGIGDLVGHTVVPTPLPGAALNIMGAPVALFVPLTCVNCAYVVFFSAATMGIFQPPRPDAGAAPKA